ncbi:MAG: hypothetical protein PVJ92_00495 [Candidatus Dependentiae bacterium]|jgi:hypothetical protein
MFQKRKIGLSMIACLLCLPICATSRFIAATKRSAKTASRNDVKESFGMQLQQIARTQADLQHQVGLFMMRHATLQQAVARQGGNLVTDAAPFDSISTARLSRAVNASKEKVDRLHELLAQVNEVNNELLSIVRLEHDDCST